MVTDRQTDRHCVTAKTALASHRAVKMQLISFRFLSRVSTLTRDIDIAILSVRLSVCNAPVSDKNGLTYCYSFF